VDNFSRILSISESVNVGLLVIFYY